MRWWWQKKRGGQKKRAIRRDAYRRSSCWCCGTITQQQCPGCAASQCILCAPYNEPCPNCMRMASLMQGGQEEWVRGLRLHLDAEIEACLKESPQFLWIPQAESPLLKKVVTFSGKMILFDPEATETMTLPELAAIRIEEKKEMSGMWLLEGDKEAI